MEIKKIYQNKDGRYRAYIRDDNNKPHVVSYPRLLLEQNLGIKLNPNDDVHHKDEDFTNNDISNLQVIPHGEHQKIHSLKYYDKDAVCEVCGKTFVWIATRQRQYYNDLSRGLNRIISCSRKCSSIYGRYIQLGYDELEALELSRKRK